MPRPRQRVCLQEGLKLDLNRLIRPRPQSNHLRRSRRRPPRAPVSFRQKSRRNLTVRPISSCGRISLPRFTTLPVIRVTGPRKQVPTCVRRRQRHRGSAPQRPRSARAHKRGCDEFDAKPIEFESLVATIRRGPAFNRQHPFVDILLSDIAESGEVLDVSELVREPPLPSFQRM
jgi:hypothetical protein